MCGVFDVTHQVLLNLAARRKHGNKNFDHVNKIKIFEEKTRSQKLKDSMKKKTRKTDLPKKAQKHTQMSL